MAKGRRILIVDDDPEMGEALAEILGDEGYSVGRASNGKLALDALASTPTDVVLLDLNMPVMNGDDFLNRRAADPTLASIPVIIMSAAARMPDKTFRTTVLAKPIDVEALLDMLHR